MINRDGLSVVLNLLVCKRINRFFNESAILFAGCLLWYRCNSGRLRYASWRKLSRADLHLVSSLLWNCISSIFQHKFLMQDLVHLSGLHNINWTGVIYRHKKRRITPWWNMQPKSQRYTPAFQLVMRTGWLFRACKTVGTVISTTSTGISSTTTKNPSVCVMTP